MGYRNEGNSSHVHSGVGITYGIKDPALPPAWKSGPRTTSMLPRCGSRTDVGITFDVLAATLNTMIPHWIPHGIREVVLRPGSPVEQRIPYEAPAPH